jgi:Tfp pilus assembly protein PilF
MEFVLLGILLHGIGLFDGAARRACREAELWEGKGEYIRAMASYTRAVAADPHFFDAFIGRALSHMALRRYDRAAADFQQALRIDPGAWIANLGMGSVYMRRRNPSGARPYFERALSLCPESKKKGIRSLMEKSLP